MKEIFVDRNYRMMGLLGVAFLDKDKELMNFYPYNGRKECFENFVSKLSWILDLGYKLRVEP